MFAMGRLPGWVAQWKEMRENNEPISRPRQVYQGHTHQENIPIFLVDKSLNEIKKSHYLIVTFLFLYHGISFVKACISDLEKKVI